ncbi:hypothetical protein BDV93DRAFT_513763 [Ceratobasidium sp. AG-I]|nr:hypothetical protein BDV93DRAFT_513763 [Ceratobasidium sp. AG-I]
MSIIVFPGRPGGFLNWERHESSKKHSRRLGILRQKPNHVTSSASNLLIDTPTVPIPQSTIDHWSPPPLPGLPLPGDAASASLYAISQTIHTPANDFYDPSIAYLEPPLTIASHLNVLCPPCCAVLYPLSDEQNIYKDYPWALHTEFSLDWIPELIDNRLYL